VTIRTIRWAPLNSSITRYETRRPTVTTSFPRSHGSKPRSRCSLARCGPPRSCPAPLFPSCVRSSPTGHLAGNRLLNIQSPPSLSLHRNACSIKFSDLPIIIAFFSFAFFLPIPHKVRYSTKALVNAVLLTHHPAMVRILLHSTYFLDPVLHSTLTLAYYGHK
jgi:hypothetical protein